MGRTGIAFVDHTDIPLSDGSVEIKDLEHCPAKILKQAAAIKPPNHKTKLKHNLKHNLKKRDKAR